MKTNLLQKPLYYPNNMGGKQIRFTGSNPLLKNQEKFDEVELEKNLDTKEGQIAFLQYHLDKAKGSQGFIARGFNKLKGWTGLGLSSKKLDAELAAFMNDQVPFEKVCQDINKFKYNQKEATEILVDGVSAAISFTMAHAYTNLGNFGNAVIPFQKVGIKGGSILNVLNGMLFGSGFKSITKFIDSFGMEKSQRKENRHFFRDMLTGGISGVSGALPGIVGTQPIPMIGSIMGGMALNSGVRYLSLDKNDKSFGDFCRQQIENPGVKLFATAGLATLAACNYKNLSEWEKVKTNLQRPIQDLKIYSSNNLETNFEKLAGDKYLNIFDESKEKSLGKILKNCSGKDAQSTLAEIEKANMFYPKYLQTLPSSFAFTEIGKKYPNIGKVIELVKSKCTGERTKTEAQKYIDDLFGQGEYIIVDTKDKDGKTVEAKPLGVGSVAETWVVKDKKNNEFVVKMVKKDVSVEKLNEQQKSLEAQLEHVTNPNEKEAQIKGLKQLFDTWRKELDLKAEAESAKTLANSVKAAKVVKPVKTSKDGNAYIMEKAKGVLFSDIIDFIDLEDKLCIETPFEHRQKRNNISKAYNQLYLEQIFCVPKTGEKIMHADPHPGNIFVNMKENGKAEFTFIDTGNVIHMSNKDAVKNMFNHLSYFIGNSEAIAELLLKNAKYPQQIDETKAKQELKEFLDKNIYNGKTLVSENTFNSVDTLALDWMTSKGIIPDPNQTNLHKAEYTYISNEQALVNKPILNKISNILNDFKDIKPYDDNLESARNKFKIKELTIEQKNLLAAIYMEEYDNCLKQIKNIQKLVDKKSYMEGKKSEILYETYIDTLKAIKAISICDDDENKVSTLSKELNNLTTETFDMIKKYNNTISDSDNKTYANDYHETYNKIFNDIKDKNITEIEFEYNKYGNPNDCQKETGDIDKDNKISKNNEFIFNYYIARDKYGKADLNYKSDDINKQLTLLEGKVGQIRLKLHNKYSGKSKEQMDALTKEDDKKDVATTAIKNMFKENANTFGLILSCPFNHPANSIHEIRQIKKYLDNNKEHVATTLRLTTGSEGTWQFLAK